MARFRVQMDDGSLRHLDAQRLVTDEGTELNGSWSWARVYPASRAMEDRTVPAWGSSW